MAEIHDKTLVETIARWHALRLAISNDDMSDDVLEDIGLQLDRCEMLLCQLQSVEIWHVRSKLQIAEAYANSRTPDDAAPFIESALRDLAMLDGNTALPFRSPGPGDDTALSRDQEGKDTDANPD